MKVGDLVRHKKKGYIGVITKWQMLDYYTVLWNNGKLQHSQKRLTHFEVISESR
tara:strand:- start:184 stop:345 length:162 start_codon:yes stop_codon:yes gene_type:complete